jgi:hypothetical protein
MGLTIPWVGVSLERLQLTLADQSFTKQIERSGRRDGTSACHLVQ